MIACEIIFRECCSLVADSPNFVDVEFLPKGLHDIGKSAMRQKLKEAIDRINQKDYDAIILGYALCNGGIVGIAADEIPIIIPKAHDCITLFLGSRSRYEKYFFANSGTYFKTIGWIERGESLNQNFFGLNEKTDAGTFMMQDLVNRYGKDNAKYIYDKLLGMKHYSKLAFIETGLEPNCSFEEKTKEVAAQNGFEFEKIIGDLSLLRRLIDGKWDDDFLVIHPGTSVDFSYDSEIIRSS